MATIVLRSVKGSALTFAEGDSNFSNLNTDKIELTDLSVTSNSASGGGALSYTNSTGVFSYTPPDLTSYIDLTDLSVTSNAASGGGALSYNNTTGAFSYTPPDLTSYIDLTDLSVTSNSASGGGALSYNNTTGAFSYTPPDLTSYGTLSNVVEDTTPQLGGTLDCQGNTVSNPVLKDYAETIHSLGSTDTPTITISNGNVQSVTITSGLSLPAFSDAATGQSVTLIVSGSGTATGTAAYKFAGGNTTLTTLSVVSIFYNGTNYFASIATDFQ